MDKSKVFFTNLHTTPSSNLLDKMERLIKRAGIESIDFKDQFVAIKIPYRLQHALLRTTCQRGRPFTKRHGKWI